MSRKMSVSLEIYTHEYLWRAAKLMLEKALQEANANKRDSDYFLISALLMSYMAFEAFINFSGYVLLPKIWAEERKHFKGKKGGVEAKIAELLEIIIDYGWKKDERPYKNIRKLKEFRDAVAHGKVKASQYEAIFKEDRSHIRWEHDWDKFISTEKAKIFFHDIKSFCQSLLESMRKKSDHLHLIYDAFEGTLGSATGRSDIR